MNTNMKNLFGVVLLLEIFHDLHQFALLIAQARAMVLASPCDHKEWRIAFEKLEKT